MAKKKAKGEKGVSIEENLWVSANKLCDTLLSKLISGNICIPGSENLIEEDT